MNVLFPAPGTPEIPMRRLLLIPALLSLATRADSVPADLELKSFSGPDLTPSPACLCASASGEVVLLVGASSNDVRLSGSVVV